MMEAAPAAALIMPEADFLLEVVIIALDAPTQLGEVDEAAERHFAVDGCEPELGGRSLALGPFDQQRLFGESCFTFLRGNNGRLDRTCGERPRASRIRTGPKVRPTKQTH
jgi:hypothetical protein